VFKKGKRIDARPKNGTTKTTTHTHTVMTDLTVSEPSEYKNFSCLDGLPFDEQLKVVTPQSPKKMIT
jgi:hypothetical protein